MSASTNQADLLIITCDRAGITNGVDTNEWNPSTDPHLPSFYSVDDLSGKVVMLPKLLIFSTSVYAYDS